MDTNDYLKKVLSSQTLADDGDEIQALQKHRADVEALLRNQFSKCSPTIRYSGSSVKGTMIKESYDLDIICYFPHDDTAAGETLEDIYNNVERALKTKYLVERKTSALRLKTDNSGTDAFLYQAGSDKKRLKTNIDVHIAHVRDGGLTDAIKLVKLWKLRNGITLKHFVLELLVIDLLKNRKRSSLSNQLEHVWTEFRDHADSLSVQDPANPEGNDLSPALDAARSILQAVARQTLSLIESSGWEAVFGAVEDKSADQTTAALRRIAAGVSVQSRPWCPDES